MSHPNDVCIVLAADSVSRVDKKFYKAASFDRWVVVVYENDRRFNMQTAQGVVIGLLAACDSVGVLASLPSLSLPDVSRQASL